ncbi:transposase family protein [Sideroxydans sp.]
MNEPAIFKPRVGMRFKMQGKEYEICYTQFGQIRYASVKGGSQYKLRISKFLDYQEKCKILVSNPDLNTEYQVRESDDGGYAPANLSQKELTEGMRRIRYAEAATAELLHPNSFKELKAWLPECAILLKDAKPPVPRSVSSWVKTYREKGRDALFAPERKRGNRTLRFPPEVHIDIQDALDEYINTKEQRDALDVLSHIKDRLEEKDLLSKDGETVAVPSERTIRRYLKKIDPYLLIRIKQGPLAAERAARAAGQKISSPGPMHLVQIDTHFLKVFVVDPDTGEILGKPYLVCAFDVRTRCVVGVYVSLMPASAATTLGVVKDMLTRPTSGLPGGIPVYLIPDNGVEFKNSAVERLCTTLSIHFEPAQVRDPNGKAHVERFFSTLSNNLIQKISGRTFTNIDERGEYNSEKEATCTLADIEKYVRIWIEEVYHQREHSGTGQVPIMHWKRETENLPKQGLTDDDVDALARTPYQVKINRGRVRVEKLEYCSHSLRTLESEHKGSVTVLLNELDMSYVYVQDPYKSKNLIKADSVEPDYTDGLTLFEHKEAQTLKKKMAEEDLKSLGKNASLLARYQLMEMIQKDSKVARKKIAKLTNGSGRLGYRQKEASAPIQDDTPPPSTVRQVTEQYREPETFQTKLKGRSDESGTPAEDMPCTKPLTETATGQVKKTKFYNLD